MLEFDPKTPQEGKSEEKSDEKKVLKLPLDDSYSMFLPINTQTGCSIEPEDLVQEQKK